MEQKPNPNVGKSVLSNYYANLKKNMSHYILILLTDIFPLILPLEDKDKRICMK